MNPGLVGGLNIGSRNKLDMSKLLFSSRYSVLKVEEQRVQQDTTGVTRMDQKGVPDS